MMRFILGLILIVVGVIGLFLPILQGVAMILVGIMLAFPESGKKIIKRGKIFFRNKFKKNG